MDSEMLIVVEGGLIQQIYGIPASITVRVKDYDVDAADEAHLQRDANGDLFCESIWTSDTSPALPDTQPQS